MGAGREKKGKGSEKDDYRALPPPPALPSFLPFFFVFALSQFRGPDYLGAWNRLLSPGQKKPSFLERYLFLCDY